MNKYVHFCMCVCVRADFSLKKLLNKKCLLLKRKNCHLKLLSSFIFCSLNYSLAISMYFVNQKLTS